MNIDIQKKRYKYHIAISFLLAIIILYLFFISFEKNKFIPVHYHSWNSSYRIAHALYTLNIFDNIRENYNFIFILAGHKANKFIGILFGIYFTIIHKFDLTHILIFNFTLILLCIILTVKLIKKRETYDFRDVFFASLVWFTPYVIYLMRSGQNYFYAMCFLFFYFYCLTINYEHKKLSLSLLSGLLLSLAYASHRIMLLYASVMFILSAILFIIIIRNKKIYQHINFLISSFVGLIPLLPYYYYYKKINFLEPEIKWRILRYQGYSLKENLLFTINDVPLLLGGIAVLILVLSPFLLKNLLQVVHKKSFVNIYLSIIIPISFLLLPLFIILLFTNLIDFVLIWYAPVIPFVIVLCLNIFHQFPSILKTIVITIKLLVILLILINNIFLCDINNYFANLYPCSNNNGLCKFRNICFNNFVFPWAAPNIDLLCYFQNYKDINILILDLFNKLDKTPSFMYIYPEGSPRLFNTLIETYAIKHNKKFLRSYLLEDDFIPSHVPNTIYIGLVADSSLLSIKDTSNYLLYENLFWLNKNQLNFLRPYLKVNSIYHIIPMHMFIPDKIIVIFKSYVDLKNKDEFHAFINTKFPSELSIAFIE